MSPISKGLASFAVAAVLSTAAAAQGLVTQKNIPLAMAQTIANAALTKCESMGFKVSVVVVDRDGLPIVMLRGDGSGLHTPEGADRKAYTARTFSQPSAAFTKRMLDDPNSVGSRQYTRVLALAGGLPIKVGRRCGRRGWRLRLTGQGRRLLAGGHRQGRRSIELMLPTRLAGMGSALGPFPTCVKALEKAHLPQPPPSRGAPVAATSGAGRSQLALSVP
jgi:uncharacterized protein GlcG (DUF336 family)